MSEELPIVYLARHGETAWTISRQHTGLTDLPLTARGEVDAVRLGERLEADRSLCPLYADPEAWAHQAIVNVASSGKFSSDRTIGEYAADIWHATPCPVS